MIVASKTRSLARRRSASAGMLVAGLALGSSAGWWLRTFQWRIRVYRACFGPVRGALLALESVLRPSDRLEAMVGRRFDRPFRLRVGSKDVDVYAHLILRREYESFTLPCEAKAIIDIGANIGLTAVWFADHYPNATILAVEPEEHNYELLESNTAAYPQIQCLRAAVSGSCQALKVVNPRRGHWGFQVVPDDEPADTNASVPGVTVQELIERLGADSVDILKMDIEGSEVEVFEQPDAWIDRIDHIIVELHDNFRPGCSRAFYRAVSGFPFEEHRNKVHHVARQNKEVKV